MVPRLKNPWSLGGLNVYLAVGDRRLTGEPDSFIIW